MRHHEHQALLGAAQRHIEKASRLGRVGKGLCVTGHHDDRVAFETLSSQWIVLMAFIGGLGRA